MSYGTELICDLKHCNRERFTRESLAEFFRQLCDLIDMEACDLHFWDDVGVAPEDCQTDPQTTGTSAVQFILTSSIVIHTLDLLGTVYINLFSCKPFDADAATDFMAAWFSGEIAKRTEIERL